MILSDKQIHRRVVKLRRLLKDPKGKSADDTILAAAKDVGERIAEKAYQSSLKYPTEKEWFESWLAANSQSDPNMRSLVKHFASTHYNKLTEATK